ncbi:hypothetical protein X777_05325 [Ooceraea biroi]|uniref:DUF4817 domain-containing protein n=1 Tax=Ooceraea biroi TaxID=2015173 RepID=A0A026WGT7_OOCBI|nr:hypothetical protein X777_05325 [Ooceraea biroi]
MSNLATEEKVYIIECFFSRGKVYSSAYREFRTKYGNLRILFENGDFDEKLIINNIYVNKQNYRFWGSENPNVAAIKKVISNIKDDMLEKVFTRLRKRIEFCTNSDGAHFEDIYHYLI